MIDVTYYQDAVLEIIVSGQHIAREVYELRLTLFVQAANCYFNRKHEVLEPFPSCFFDTASNSRRHDELQACVTSIQELRAINVRVFIFKALAKRLNKIIFSNTE